MTIDIAASDKLLTTTRGVRKRMDFSRPVEPEIIRQSVEVAMQAPDGGMEWPTHFIVATEPDAKRRIADLYRKVCDPYLDDLEAKMNSGGDRPKSGVDLYRWQADTLYELPALVIVAIEGRFESEPVGMQAAKYGMALPVAYYTGNDFKPAKRPPADNFIHWNRWGEHTSPAG